MPESLLQFKQEEIIISNESMLKTKFISNFHILILIKR